MIGTITIKERGPTPRRFQSAHNKASKAAWLTTGKHFHGKLRDKRFTESHARQAGYTPRSKRYERYKRFKLGHNRPLEWSGETRRLARFASISSTSKGGRVRYPQARKLNFRARGEKVNKRAEFVRIIKPETIELAGVYDKDLDKGLGADNETTVRTI